MSTIRPCTLALIAAIASSAADAATFADLSGGPDPQAFAVDAYGFDRSGAGPYAATPYNCPCPAPGAERGYAGGGYGPPLAPPPPNYSGYTAQAGPAAAGPYGGAPRPFGAEARPSGSPFSGGPEGAPPVALDGPAMPPPAPPPAAFSPYGHGAGLPNGPLQAATFQQVNSTTDPYNSWGLSTPFMFVPWSTPLSGWTNAQTWSWWRERSGASPYGW